MKAIDVSHWNINEMNESYYKKYIDDGVQMIIAKYSEGATLIDKCFDTYKDIANSCHMLFAGYHYLNSADMSNDFALREVKRIEEIAKITGLRPWVDFEEPKMINNKGYQYLFNVLEQCAYDGYPAGIYLSYSLLRNPKIFEYVHMMGIPVWVARYKYKAAYLSGANPEDKWLQKSAELYGDEIKSAACQFTTTYKHGNDSWSLDGDIIFNAYDFLGIR